MKSLLIVLMGCLAAGPLGAEEMLQAVSFAEAAERGDLRTGVVMAGDVLRVEALPGQPVQPLMELPDPGITSAVYALRGMIRYEAVEGDGYLEMNSHFGSQGTFFTRTMAGMGPLRQLSGTSGWRPFVLPFDASTGDGAAHLTPGKLSLNLHLPGAGTVWLKDVALFQFAPGEDPLQAGGQWFGNRTASLIGAVGGSLVGLWGGLIGVLSGRGRARGFVLGSVRVLFLIGVVSLCTGIVAVGVGQPYAVYFPLVLLGGLLVVLLWPLRGRLAARYEELELKRVQAMDV